MYVHVYIYIIYTMENYSAIRKKREVRVSLNTNYPGDSEIKNPLPMQETQV